MVRVAFICTHNSCRSIMAEGWAKHLGSNIIESHSAGTESYPNPKPLAIEVMEDCGVSMSHAKSKLISKIPKELDIIITMGYGVECPYIPSKHQEDCGLDDPSERPKEDFEYTRDLIKDKVLELIKRIENNDFDL